MISAPEAGHYQTVRGVELNTGHLYPHPERIRKLLKGLSCTGVWEGKDAMRVAMPDLHIITITPAEFGE